ncbi:MAG: hypothetical protein Ct9H300mP28_38060 [Pseudomonadota bacterium]|nr:MAG: hypothetical protein Ct9H300mP28_38060 [Pseudomonadota bacterium]
MISLQFTWENPCVLTNTAPIGAYRGAGRPEGIYPMERLIDMTAREMGIDRLSFAEKSYSYKKFYHTLHLLEKFMKAEILRRCLNRLLI